MKKLILFLILLAPISGYAQTPLTVPDQKILGADTIYPVGELIALGVTPISPKPDNLDQVTYTWDVIDPLNENKTFKDLGDGSVIFGGGGQPHSVNVMCVISYLYLVKENNVVKTVSVRTRILKAKVQIGAINPVPSVTVPTNSLANDYLNSYRTALYNAAKAMRANSAALIAGTKSIKDIRDAMLIEWANARSQAFDKYYKAVLTGIIPEGATTVTPAQIEQYAKTLESIGDAVVK